MASPGWRLPRRTDARYFSRIMRTPSSKSVATTWRKTTWIARRSRGHVPAEAMRGMMGDAACEKLTGPTQVFCRGMTQGISRPAVECLGEFLTRWNNGRYGWTDEDMKELALCNLAIASDVAYAHGVTENFISFAEWFLGQVPGALPPPKSLFAPHFHCDTEFGSHPAHQCAACSTSR